MQIANFGQPLNDPVGAAMPDLGAIPDSLVPFSAFRIIGASIVFRNERFDAALSDAELLNRYAFAVRSRDLVDRLEARGKMFHADRYGGAGLLRNGGSGRCGYDGKYQIKGIGQTPLVGRRVAAMYADGMLPLCDAIAEAAWGEIAHCILPYGGVRAVGVLSTGTSFERRRGERVGRGLLIREAALRPAHFERAIYFRPGRRFRSETRSHDAQRTADALARLPSIFRCGLLAGNDLADPGEIVVRGLIEFVERFASQVAAAQAKRLMHGALASSNLALDGRWLDFGCTTSLPLTLFGDDRDYPRFWREPDGVLQGVSELIFYTQKYIPEFRPFCNDALDAVGYAYHSRLSSETRFRFLLLTGVPQPILRRMPADEKHANALAGLIARMFRGGFKPPAAIPDPIADSKVGAVFLTLARYYRDPSCESRIAPYVTGRVQPYELLKAYSDFIDQASATATHCSLSPADFAIAMRTNALRLSRYPEFMYRPKLLEQIETCIASSFCPESLRASVTRLLDRIHCRSKVLLTDREDLTSVLWSDESESLCFSPVTGTWELASAGTKLRFCTQQFASRVEKSQVGRQLRRHFGQRFLEFIV